MASIEFSVVIPVFRGRETLEPLCRRLVDVFTERGSTFEILLVDDGSSDGSWERIREIARNEPHVTGIRLTRNFGQHNATLCGFRNARGDLIVTLDEDLESPPEEIGKLIECQAESGADVVYGTPMERKGSWWRRLGSRIVMLIPRFVMKINFDISAFRLIRGPIAREVAQAQRHDIIIDVYFAWITDRIVATPVQRVESARASSYTPWKLIGVLFNILYNYTVLPLRVSVVIGGVLSAGSLVLAGIFVYLRIKYQVVEGFTALIVSILFSTGVLLLAIGMVSEYLAHMFLHVIRKPQSVVRETTRDERDAG